MIKFYLCIVCVPRACFSASWLFVCSPLRAITGLFEMLKSVLSVWLHQPVSTCLRGSLSAVMVVVLLLLSWCCFQAHSSSLNALITAPDGGISLHLHMLTLILTCYLSLIVVFRRDIFGTKTSKSPGWCTHRHTHTLYTHFQTLSLTSSQCCWYPTLFEVGAFDVLFLRHSQPHRALSCPLLGPAHYYTSRHLSSSPVACWISNWSSVVCEALSK